VLVCRQSALFAGLFSASTNGVVTYMGGGSAGTTQITWFEWQGKNLGTVGISALLLLSTERPASVVSRQDSPGRASLWLYDLTRGGTSTLQRLRQFQILAFPRTAAAIAFTSSRDGARNLYQKLTSGIRMKTRWWEGDETSL
jgi:hypothetical protein